tara:strand:- start:552 stop:773 length:222 start_codon:yes stop_codon:yes gene_type:complete
VLISIGNYNLYSHINFLDSFEEFEVEIINNELFKSASYFDIPSNIWVLRGLRKAVKKDRTYANPQYLKIKGII